MKKLNCVVSGYSVITPFGNSVNETWDILVKGGNAVSSLPIFPERKTPKIAAYIEQERFNTMCNLYLSERTDRSTILALSAVHSLLNTSTFNPNKTGLIVGTGIGTSELPGNLYAKRHRDNKRFPAFTITSCMQNATASRLAITFGLKRFNTTLFTACSSGTNAIGMAYRLISSGQESSIIVVGVDAALNTDILEAWASLRITSDHNDSNACCPFSENRSGLVLGEGVGVMMLESYENAKKHNRIPLAEIKGYASNCDATHLTQPDVHSQTMVIAEALHDAKIAPCQIDLISAHGTSTLIADKSESDAINAFFRDQSSHIPVTALKSQFGHTIGASGVLETIFSIEMMRRSTILPTLHYKQDPLINLNIVTSPTTSQITHVLKNSFGFGGNNAALILKKV